MDTVGTTHEQDVTGVDDQTLVALTPLQMGLAQHELGAWCDRKIAAVRTELRDLETNLELATEHGWKHRSVAATVERTKKRIVYYEKIKTAIAAGYVIVPNFPVNVFAVRVQRRRQQARTSDYATSEKFKATPELLPTGEGRYVDERVFTTSAEYTAKNYEGKEITRTRYTSAEYDDVDFPVSLVKPMVAEATARAMALKLFDQLGIVQDRMRGDPIVVGQLLDPRGNGRRVTLFIAWWLDTETL